MVEKETDVDHFRNPAFRRPAAPQTPSDESQRTREAVRADVAYAPTPLVDWPRLASTSGVASVSLKDEGARLADAGLASFKPLGPMGVIPLLAARYDLHNLTFVCASDGNYGRAVAWAAQRAGAGARVYLPDTVTPGRFEAIRRFGAEAIAVPGGYDAAIALAAQVGRDAGFLEFPDTGRVGYEEIPRQIEYAYGVIVDECLDALGDATEWPTHVFIPAGVGGLVSGLAQRLAERLGPQMPRIISVEPRAAASVFVSLTKGLVASTEAGPHTSMECLACETPSTSAWPVLRELVTDALAISDDQAAFGLRELSEGSEGVALATQPSGAAAFAGFRAAVASDHLRQKLSLMADARVLCLVTEGPADLAQGRYDF